MKERSTFVSTNRNKKKMTLAQTIKSNPYLNVSNCTDVADLEHAMDCLRKLDREFGENNKTLLAIWSKMLNKKKQLEK